MNLPDPMLLSESKVSPLGRPGWIYEVKYDGHRMLAGIVKGLVHLRSRGRDGRGGANYTARFPEVASDLAQLGDGPHILDGEICVLDEDGRSIFDPLQDRAVRSRPRPSDPPATFMVFDALAIDGRPLIGLPVEQRKAALQELLPAGDDALDHVRFVQHFDAEHGRSLFQQAVKLRLEGLVAKRLGSAYEPGERTEAWLKVKVRGAVPPERFKR